ncbi:MAG: hypothetical protein JRJ87_05570 [Deltaproteobacteria bacterium]|nr:hypothetical protein [Deltaproteobacteria bacterium]
MRKLFMLAILPAVVCVYACSSSNDNSCVSNADCPRNQYCAASGLCEAGCVSDADCPDGTCNLSTHQCQTADDGGPDGDGGTDGGGDTGNDPGPGDQAADQGECQATHDKQMGVPCDCDDECAPAAPFCFADIMNDSGPLYCTIRDCTAGSCPANYECNDFYTTADPPQPPFCQKCLGGTPRDIDAECKCDSDCGDDAPVCFKNIADETAPAMCTITGCAIGAGDTCPGIHECWMSFDMADPDLVVNFCKICDPGDGSLAEGTECGCNKDCAGEAICTKDIGSEDPMKCVVCLGGTPRGFGEACECDVDCGVDYPKCLINNNYCSVLNCLDDPNITCPEDSHCEDFYGIFSYCMKDE